MMCVFTHLNSYFPRILTVVTILSHRWFISLTQRELGVLTCSVSWQWQCRVIRLCYPGPQSACTFCFLGKAEAGYRRHTASTLFLFWPVTNRYELGQSKKYCQKESRTSVCSKASVVVTASADVYLVSRGQHPQDLYLKDLANVPIICSGWIARMMGPHWSAAVTSCGHWGYGGLLPLP